MANYRLPMDADGMKYHGTVDQNEENPGQFMYGLDENGNKRIIRTDEQGNVLTKVTGSIVEEIIPRQLFTEGVSEIVFEAPENAKGAYISLWIRGVTGTFESDEGLDFWSRLETTANTPNLLKLEEKAIKTTGRYLHAWGVSNGLGDAVEDTARAIKLSPIIPQKTIRLRFEVTGTFQQGEGFDLQGSLLWF